MAAHGLGIRCPSHLPAILFLVAAPFLSHCVRVDVALQAGHRSSQAQYDQNPEGGGELYVFSSSQVEPGASSCSMDITHHSQQTGTWCWAASTRTVMEYIKKETHVANDQCNLVSEMFKLELAQASTLAVPLDCCKARRDFTPALTDDNALAAARNSREICATYGVWPDEVFDHPTYRFAYDLVYYPPDDGGLDWDALKTQLCSGGTERPILSVIKWERANYHTLVVGGYRTPPGGEQFVEIYDPGGDGYYLMHYEDFFLGIPGEFSHVVDYINIRKQP